ncbi:MAG TPA: transcriptional regulator [Bacteroidetes bacterium]|nr:transcriptional regulator [Bacteroidota bacterium]
MIDILISSKTRVKLLLKFFLNTDTVAYLRGLESEFGESSNAIRLELNKLEEAGFLKSETQGNRKVFGANKRHPLFSDIHSILLKYTGIDQIIERVINRLGNLEEVYLVGELGKGNDSPIIDLIFVGEIDKITLTEYIDRAEEFVHKKIRYVQFNRIEFDLNRDALLNGAHIVLWQS